jgi:hypothetical protein
MYLLLRVCVLILFSGARFVVYQHLIAFKTSAEPSCRTPQEQWDSFLKLGGQDESTDRAGEEVSRVHRLDSSQKHMWRTGLRLLESLIIFPPLPAGVLSVLVSLPLKFTDKIIRTEDEIM